MIAAPGAVAIFIAVVTIVAGLLAYAYLPLRRIWIAIAQVWLAVPAVRIAAVAAAVVLAAHFV